MLILNSKIFQTEVQTALFNAWLFQKMQEKGHWLLQIIELLQD